MAAACRPSSSFFKRSSKSPGLAGALCCERCHLLFAETGERDSVYLYAIRTANDDHDEAVAKTFDETRDVEVEHANLCADALRNLADMKAPHEDYVCERCGYTTNARLPLCPSCRDRHPLH